MLIFDVVGCCVCRDIFNYLDQEKYSLDKKITLYVNAHICDRNLDSLSDYLPLFGNSDFMRRMGAVLIAGNLFEILDSSNVSDYNADNHFKKKADKWLIMDFANERFPLQLWQYEDQCGMMPVCWDTYKWGQAISEKTNRLSVTDWHFADRNERQYICDIEKYIDNLLEIYGKDHIIYIQTRLCDTVRDDKDNRIYSFTDDSERYKGIEKPWIREKGNQLIAMAEKILLKKVPNVYVVPLPPNVFVNCNHIWGVHPLHYDDLYYEYAAEAIKLIAKDIIEGDIEDRHILVERELRFLLRRYDNKFIRVKGVSKYI